MSRQKMILKTKSVLVPGVLSLGFLCMGLMSGCSEVKREVVDSKQATAIDRSKTYDHGDRSLWNLSHREVN